MSSIVLGKADGKNVSLDLDKLLSTRLLVQANSGKGKSHLLRRIAEQLFGKVQVIIIDPEGEFATLREKYGYVLVGKGGETPADPRSAGLVAHKLLELRASAVCDLYEMKPQARHEWVKKFLDAMIDAPKSLWHPCVVIADEAHVFCPEKGAGESEASDAMIGLATRGRKRGFACIFATQRLGKLRKDAAAELLNIMVGGTFIDVDRLGSLRSAGMIEYPSPGKVRCAHWILMEAA
jgi:DNA helicase HerA-like ATPase